MFKILLAGMVTIQTALHAKIVDMLVLVMAKSWQCWLGPKSKHACEAAT
jgi:hypothetical protein